MKYFSENMNADDARKRMFHYAAETRGNDNKYDEIKAEYDRIMPILYDKEKASPDYLNTLTS